MRVVFKMQPSGEFSVVTDEPCEVYIVSDHCPGDRVYRLTESHIVGGAAVDAVLSCDPVGHAGDDRHAAIKHHILSAAVGDYRIIERSGGYEAQMRYPIAGRMTWIAIDASGHWADPADWNRVMHGASPTGACVLTTREAANAAVARARRANGEQPRSI